MNLNDSILPKFLDQKTMETVSGHEGRLLRLENHAETCDHQHQEHRRRAEDAVKSQNEMNETLKSILDKLTAFEQYMPSVRRTDKNYLIFDSVNELLWWIAKVATSVLAIVGLYSLFKTFI